MPFKYGQFKSHLGEIKVTPKKNVLDWVKAAHLIKEHNCTSAEAGLQNEPMSVGTIYQNRRPVLRDKSYAFVESSYDVPVLIINSDVYECHKLVEMDAEEEFWPAEALEVLGV